MSKKPPRATIFAIITIVAIISASPVFGGSNAIVTQLKGRVEIRYGSGDWIPAEEGMILDPGALISTGLGASAILEVGESVLNIKPLTRMAIDELITDSGLQTTRLSLRIGRVRAEVKTTRSVSHDFKIRSPTSTAAVRGTVFDFQEGILHVNEGQVILQNAFSHSVNAGPNERAFAPKDRPPEWSNAAEENYGQINAPVPGSDSKGKSEAHPNRGRGKGPYWAPSVDKTGTVIITWR